MAVKSDHYTAAGVNIDAGDEMVRQIGPLAASTRIPGAVGGLGGFGGLGGGFGSPTKRAAP